jgi:hypothetical protein
MLVGGERAWCERDIVGVTEFEDELGTGGAKDGDLSDVGHRSLCPRPDEVGEVARHEED